LIFTTASCGPLSLSQEGFVEGLPHHDGKHLRPDCPGAPRANHRGIAPPGFRSLVLPGRARPRPSFRGPESLGVAPALPRGSCVIGPALRCHYRASVLPGLATAGEERTSPSTAQALAAWVIGSRFLGGLPSRMIARETIGHTPSSRCVFARNDCPLRTVSSSGFTPASARA